MILIKQGIPNATVLLSPLTTQEAVLSSKIEGTQASLDEVLEHEAGLVKSGEKEKDIQEIINYRKAILSAKENLKDRPITLPFVRQLHKILLTSVRGQDKTPGQFRKDQNWIGTPGSTIDRATFVPPSPLQLDDYLQAWQMYLKSDDIDFILQSAIVHAQFELLHPFKDGNGRIGRILIPLFLFQKHMISEPMFYLSAYLEKHRDLYYDKLRRISAKGDWNGWIEFFLGAIIEQAVENTNKVKKIMALYDSMKQTVQELTRSQYAVRVLDALFCRPIFTSNDFVVDLDIHRATLSFLRKFKEAGILYELRPASGRSPAIWAFMKLLGITEVN